jgi:hypothetical protein
MEEQSPKYRLYSSWITFDETAPSQDFGAETFEVEEAARRFFALLKIGRSKQGYRPWGMCKIVRPDGSEVVLSQ